MTKVEKRRYQVMVKVSDFWTTHAADFPTSSLAGQIFALVASAVAAIDANTATRFSRGGSARNGTNAVATARQALRAQLEAISRTAGALAHERPDLEDKFKVPRRPGDQAMLAAARVFARDAAPLAAEFAAHELADDFAAQLNSGIAVLEQAIHERHAGKEASVSATAAIVAALESGMEAVDRLDAIVRNRLERDPQAMAAWDHARHLGYPPRGKRAVPAAPTASPAAAVAPETK